MTNREKIAWLKRYINLDRRINCKLERCEELRSRLGKVTTTINEQPGGGGSIYYSKDHDIILTINDLIAKMEQEVNDWIEIRAEIAATIESVEDNRERELLEYRYLYGHTFEQIAARMFYSWKQIHRLHSKALDGVEIKMSENVPIESAKISV